jgi:hypothetical protein
MMILRMSMLGVLAFCLLSCASAPLHAGPATGQGELASRLSQEEETHSDAVSVNAVRDLLDTIQAELLLARVCKGGESIDVWVRPAPDRDRVLEVIYRVPNILHIYREAYVQRDGTVLLADSLDFGFRDTRYSTHEVEEEELRELRSYTTHVSARLAHALRPEQVQAQQARQQRIEESYRDR